MKEFTCNFCKKNCKYNCKSCKIACYCNQECQKADWKKHQQVCLILCCARETIEEIIENFQKMIKEKGILPIDPEEHKEYLILISKTEKNFIYFFIDLLIASTRIFEVYNLDNNNKPLYPDWIEKEYIIFMKLVGLFQKILEF